MMQCSHELPRNLSSATQVPRELLLILKTNDCLRSVDKALGAPINNFVISARV